MKKALIIVLIIAVIGGAIAIAANNNKDTNPTNPTPPPTSSNQSATPPTNPTGNNSSSNPQSSAAQNINIVDMNFSPASISIKKGTTVSWTNKDSIAHTVVSDTGNELHSENLENGETYSHTFNTAGTFKYHCSIHPNMQATVTVTE